MYNAVVTLVSKAVDVYGDETTTTRDVFCRLQSVGMSEFYQAYNAGLKPEIRFILPDYEEWEQESTVYYNDTEYRVIRTYINPETNEIELTCESIVDGGY